jgi:FtsP/CotA-like multicopper oxidase with cupredoxin domain
VKVTGKAVKAKALPTNTQMASLAPFGTTDLSKMADGVQQVQFKIGSAYDGTDGRNYFHVNNYAFNPDRVRYLQLGAVEAWTLSSAGDPPGVPNGANKSTPVPQLPHVFHIHINPFQLTRTGPDGNPQLVWKDTLLVPGQVKQADGTYKNSPPVQVFTTYTDYIGQYVMHCHILDHEDLGMMEVIEVVGVPPFPVSQTALSGP